MKQKEIREWVNTLISFLVLIVMILGLVVVTSININLNNINAERGDFREINSMKANLTSATIGPMALIEISGACDLLKNGSICKNKTGTYIVG